MKIGLFGGTFNPFHNGHLGIIQHVKKNYGLERVYLIPSATPPHKPDAGLAPASDRFKMAESSVQDEPDLVVSDKELTRKGPSYTIDTINAFKNDHDPDTEFYLLMGSDAFLDIDTWKSTQELFKAVRIIIMLRGEWENTDKIFSFIHKNISDQYDFNRKSNAFHHADKKSIYICKVPRIDISSTMVRDYIKNNKPVKGLVPDIVQEIITQKELYK